MLPNGNPLPELFTFTKEELEMAPESVGKVVKKVAEYKGLPAFTVAKRIKLL